MLMYGVARPEKQKYQANPSDRCANPLSILFSDGYTITRTLPTNPIRTRSQMSWKLKTSEQTQFFQASKANFIRVFRKIQLFPRLTNQPDLS